MRDTPLDSAWISFVPIDLPNRRCRHGGRFGLGDRPTSAPD